MKALLVLFALSGCVMSAQSVERLGPAATYESQKTVADLEMCLGQALNHLGGPSVLRGEAETVLLFGSGNVGLRVALAPTSAGASVRVQTGLPYFANVRSRVEGCI
jgi:hypothetical protein